MTATEARTITDQSIAAARARADDKTNTGHVVAAIVEHIRTAAHSRKNCVVVNSQAALTTVVHDALTTLGYPVRTGWSTERGHYIYVAW